MRTFSSMLTIKNTVPVLLIIIITAASYLPIFENDFLNYWDTPHYSYIKNNPHITDLSLQSLKTYFLGQYDGHYHPLTLLSLAIDYQIGGLDPAQYHLTSYILHILNTLLVFWLILRLCNNYTTAVVTAALFGVHTLHVESVAWMSERKDLLYSFFYLSALISYVVYTSARNKKYYICAMALFLLSLLSKSQALSLAVTLLAVDYFSNRNVFDKKVLLEKVPFLLLSMAFGLGAWAAQKSAWDLSENPVSFVARIVYAGYAFVQYIAKLLVPLNLSAIYPYRFDADGGIPLLLWCNLVTVALVCILAAYAAKRSRLVFFGVAFFIINIFLLLKLFPVPKGNYYMADRYSYLPSIGFFFIAAVAFTALLKRTELKAVLKGLFIVYVAFLSVATYERCKIWKNDITFWNDIVAKNPTEFYAWSKRGFIRNALGDVQGALADYNRALEIRPGHYETYTAQAKARSTLGDYAGALTDLDIALRMRPGTALLHTERAVLRAVLKDFNGALADLDKALRLDPDYTFAYYLRGKAKHETGQNGCPDLHRAHSLGYTAARNELDLWCGK